MDFSTPVRPNAPTPSPEQSKLIEDLGGPAAVAKIVREWVGCDMTGQAVSMWKRRGIPYGYRGLLARVAGEQGKDVPPNFLIRERAPARSPDDDDAACDT